MFLCINEAITGEMFCLVGNTPPSISIISFNNIESSELNVHLHYPKVKVKWTWMDRNDVSYVPAAFLFIEV